MSKNWIMLTGLLLLGLVGPSQAHPLDAPDIVYIDGLPCNSACQTYMAWSRRKTSVTAQHSAPVESAGAEAPPLKIVPETSAPRPARRAVAAHRDGTKPASRRVAKQPAPKSPARTSGPKPAAEPAVNAEPAPAVVTPSISPDMAAVASPPAAVEAPVAAVTPPAEQVTVAPAPTPQQEAANAEPPIKTAAAEAVDTTSIQPVTSDTGDKSSSENRVAVVMTRPEIEQLSDLAGKDLAIEEEQSASSTSLKAAIASAGAAEVNLNEGSVKAVDRLINGDVPAALLAIASPDAAEQIPEMPGYRIFRIPLSHLASEAGAGRQQHDAAQALASACSGLLRN